MTTVINSNQINYYLDKLGFFSCIMLGLWCTVATAGASISMGVLFFCFIFSGNWSRKIQLLKHPLVICAFTIFIWELIGVLYSNSGWHQSLNIALKYNKLFIIWCVVYFIDGRITRLYWVLGGLITGVLLNLIAIYINYFILPQNHAIAFVRANWPSAQGHGQFALFTLIFAFSFLIAAGMKQFQKHWRWIFLVLGLLALVAEIFLNSSRTGYVMEFVILFCLLLQSRKILTFLGMILTIAILFGGAYYISPIFKQRVDAAYYNVIKYHEGQSNTTSVGYRLYFYETTLDILAQNPNRLIFGYGSGSYKTVTNQYFANLKNKNMNFSYSGFPNPHNQYLLFLFENGIVGIIIFIVFLYTIWRYIKKLPYLWCNIGWVTLVGMMVNMLFNSTFMDFPTSIIFIPIIGLLAAYRPNATFTQLRKHTVHS